MFPPPPKNSHSQKIRIFAFCESHNQIFIADSAARAWSDWAEVTAVSFPKVLKLNPNMILGAKNLHDFIFLDRAGAKDAIIFKGIEDWLSTLPTGGVCVLSFNDGSRLAKTFMEVSRRRGLPGFVIQDGFLGHETGTDKKGFKKFLKVHNAIMDGSMDLVKALNDDETTKLYQTHCATTKLGRSRNCMYFVRGQDLKVKVCISHKIRPEFVHVIGSVHGQMEGSCDKFKTAKFKKTLLYVGQCHTLHGKISEAAWLEICSQIFAVLEKVPAKVYYKFHPSETAAVRERLLGMIPSNVEILGDGVLTRSNLVDFDYVMSEYSSVLLDAIQAKCKIVVLDTPELSERLPRLTHKNAFAASTTSLAKDLTAILAKKAKPMSSGVSLEQLEATSRASIFEDVAQKIKENVLPGSGLPVGQTPRSLSLRAAEIAEAISPCLHEMARQSKMETAYFDALGDIDILIKHFESKNLGLLIAVLKAVLGEEWLTITTKELPEFARRYKQPEIAFVAEKCAALSHEKYRQVVRAGGGNVKIRKYLKLAYAAFAPSLELKQRTELLFREPFFDCPDSCSYLAKVIERVPFEARHDQTVAFAQVMYPNGSINVDYVAEAAKVLSAENVLSFEAAVIAFLSAEKKKPYSRAVQVIHGARYVQGSTIDMVRFVQEAKKHSVNTAAQLTAMDDYIAYCCKLAEGMHEQFPDDTLMQDQSEALLCALEAEKPKSRRIAMARKLVSNSHSSLSPVLDTVNS